MDKIFCSSGGQATQFAHKLACTYPCHCSWNIAAAVAAAASAADNRWLRCQHNLLLTIVKKAILIVDWHQKIQPNFRVICLKSRVYFRGVYFSGLLSSCLWLLRTTAMRLDAGFLATSPSKLPSRRYAAKQQFLVDLLPFFSPIMMIQYLLILYFPRRVHRDFF